VARIGTGAHHFRKLKPDEGDEPDDNLRIMEVLKSNYGPVGDQIPLRYRDGLFLPLGSMSISTRSRPSICS
jgi:hypothetical protein